MKFFDYIEPTNIELNIPFSSKKMLFEQLAIKLGESDKETRKIYDSLVKREKLGATALGNGVAIPHGKCLDEKEVRIYIVVLNKAVNYESVDGILVQLIICVLFPKNTTEFHKKLLINIGDFFKKHKMYREIINAKSAKAIFKIILEKS